jgi:hypothetical protein
MSLRKWIVRGLVFGITAVMLAGAVLYYEWTNPVFIRTQVIENLTRQFPGARVNVESARMRLFGGISMDEVRLTRKDDAAQTDFLYIPSAIIFHDKEQLVDGKLVILKVELHRPRLRIVREADGSWNLDGLLAPSNPDERMPMLVFQQATVLLEDRQAPEGTPPVEIKDLNFTLVNDPLPKVTFEATGVADAMGPIHAHGNWLRTTGEASLSFELSSIPIGSALAQRLTGYCPDLVPHIRQLEGAGKIEGTIAYDPKASRPVSSDIQFGITKGKFNHARLPTPLEDMEASLRYVDGRIPLVKFRARAGAGTIAVAIKDLDVNKCVAPGEKHLQDLMRELDVQIDHLLVSGKLFECLPDEYRENIWEQYKPTGVGSATFTLRHEGKSWSKRLSVTPEGATAEYVEFKYPVKGVTGTIIHQSSSAQSDRLHLELVGLASNRPVYIQGDVAGERPDHSVNLTIWGDNLPLDKKVETALGSIGQPEEGAKYQEIARSFHPSGLGDFRVSVRRDPKTRAFTNRYVINFHDCKVRYDPFQTDGRLPGYALENVRGVLDLQPPNWEFHDFQGSHKGGTFTTSGRAVPDGKAKRIEVDFTGKNFLLDDEMKKALDDDLRKTWDVFTPEGRVDYSGRVVVLSPAPKDAKADIDLTVSPRRCAIRPTFFPYRIEDLVGTLHYKDGRVDLTKLRARNGKSNLSVDSGYILMLPNGTAYADLKDLLGTPLWPTQELIDALPGMIKKGCIGLELKDPLTIKTRLVIQTSAEGCKPDVFWDGTGQAKDISLRTGVLWEHVSGEIGSRGRYDGKELLGVTSNFRMTEGTVLGQTVNDLGGHLTVTRQDPEILRVSGLYGTYCGGEVYGEGRVEFGPTLRYELNLTGSQIKLQEFGKQNFGPKSEMSGSAVARLYLAGEGSDPSRLTGNGSIDVPNGKMYSLPLLLDLLKFLGLRLPDRTLFEEAHAEFKLEGQTAKIKDLKLFGNVISLRGKGSIDFTNPDASGLNLDFNVDWARIGQVLPQPLKSFESTLSDNLYMVRMRGTTKKPEFSQVPLPTLTGPIKEFLNNNKPNSGSSRASEPWFTKPGDTKYRGVSGAP